MVRGQAPRATRRGGKGRPPQTEDISVKGKGRGEIHGKRSRGTHQSDKPVMRGKGHRAKRGRGGGRNPQTKETVPQGRELRATSTRRSGRCQTKGTVAREVGSRETCEKKLGKDTTASKRGRRSQQRGATSSRQGRGRGVVRRGFCNEDLTRVALLQQKRSEAMNVRFIPFFSYLIISFCLENTFPDLLDPVNTAMQFGEGTVNKLFVQFLAACQTSMDFCEIPHFFRGKFELHFQYTP